METGPRNLHEAVSAFSPACWDEESLNKQPMLCYWQLYRWGTGVMILLYYAKTIPTDDFPASSFAIWIYTSDNIKTGKGIIFMLLLQINFVWDVNQLVGWVSINLQRLYKDPCGENLSPQFPALPECINSKSWINYPHGAMNIIEKGQVDYHNFGFSQQCVVFPRSYIGEYQYHAWLVQIPKGKTCPEDIGGCTHPCSDVVTLRDVLETRKRAADKRGSK